MRPAEDRHIHITKRTDQGRQDHIEDKNQTSGNGNGELMLSTLPILLGTIDTKYRETFSHLVKSNFGCWNTVESS